MKKAGLDLYSDYVLRTLCVATATGLSAMAESNVSHDQITRVLSAQEYTPKNLCQQVKSTVSSIEHDNGVLIFEGTIQEKVWTDESELVCWHFDHCSGRTQAQPPLRLKRRGSQVPHAHASNPRQPRLHGDLRHIQT
jgi:hypothetical protein